MTSNHNIIEANLPTPSTPKGKATLARILDAGRTVFGESGYVAMRMVDLAEAAGLSMGALYRYVDNKDDVFLAIIRSIHDELYEASRAAVRGTFRSDPYASIIESNHGYMAHYAAHRKVMRALVEATMVDERYAAMWWYMREQHIMRVTTALARDHGITEISGLPARISLEALASTTEQSAYVWYAHPSKSASVMPVADAARIVSDIWYRTLFSGRLVEDRGDVAP